MKTLNQQGTSALNSNDLAVALARFQDAARIQPDNREIQFNLGLTLIRIGRPRDAILHLRDASADPALSQEARYLIGVAYFSLAEYANAAAAIQDLKASARAEHVLFMLEESNRLLNHVQEARQYFVELDRRFPDSPWLHYLLGAAYENQSQPEKALAEYKLSLARDPHQPNASFAIGYLYWRQQDYDSAKLWFEKELSNQTCHAWAAYYLGEMARTSQEFQTAARYYSRSLDCDPGLANAHLRLGIVLAELNRDNEALGELRRAAELDPENSSPHYRLALLYKKLGRTADSRAEYDTVGRLQAASKTKDEPSQIPKH